MFLDYHPLKSKFRTSGISFFSPKFKSFWFASGLNPQGLTPLYSKVCLERGGAKGPDEVHLHH